MFTGLVEATGVVVECQREPSLRIAVELPAQWHDSIEHGASVACSGVCLTVVSRTEPTGAAGVLRAEFDLGPTTEERTTASGWQCGSVLNLERSVTGNTRLGGHFVLGHVDVAVDVLSITSAEEYRYITFALPSDLRKFVCAKGSVAVNGVSLTVTECGEAPLGDDSWLRVMLIPETLVATNLGALNVGDKVNLEIDPIARYAVNAMKYMQPEANSPNATGRAGA